MRQTFQQALDAIGCNESDLPEDKGTDRWTPHFTCPLCKHKPKSASINFRAGWFHCFACGPATDQSWATWIDNIGLEEAGNAPGVKRYADLSLVSRFRLQLDREAAMMAANFHWYVQYEDARQYAAYRLMVYAGMCEQSEVDYGPGDWNLMPQWERDCAGDQNKLDSFVSIALRRDLHDYGTRKRASYANMSFRDNVAMADLTQEARTERLPDPALGERNDYISPRWWHRNGGSIPQPDDFILWDDIPVLKLRCLDQYSVEEIAQILRVSVRTVQRRIAAEREKEMETRRLVSAQ